VLIDRRAPNTPLAVALGAAGDAHAEKATRWGCTYRLVCDPLAMAPTATISAFNSDADLAPPDND
jgi:hypothetical protein